MATLLKDQRGFRTSRCRWWLGRCVGISKQVCTNLNYCVLEESTTTIFLSNDHSLYAPITSDECHAWLYLYGTSRPARSALKATKYKMEKNSHNRTPNHNLEILARCSSDWATKVTFILTCTSDANVYIGISSKMMNRAYFVLYMYCFVLHIGIYLYLKIAEGLIIPVFAFNMQNTNKHSTRSGIMFSRVLHAESKHRTCSTLCYLSNIIYIYSNIQHKTLLYKTKRFYRVDEVRIGKTRGVNLLVWTEPWREQTLQTKELLSWI